MSGAREGGGVEDEAGVGVDWETVELLAVARVAKTRGVRGEVVANLLTDFPERFDRLEELVAVGPAGGRELLVIENHWLHGPRVVLKFEGYDAPETARALVGRELAVPESEAVELEEGDARAVEPVVFNRQQLALARGADGDQRFEPVEAFGEVGEEVCGHLAAHPARLHHPRDGHQLGRPPIDGLVRPAVVRRLGVFKLGALRPRRRARALVLSRAAHSTTSRT